MLWIIATVVGHVGSGRTFLRRRRLLVETEIRKRDVKRKLYIKWVKAPTKTTYQSNFDGGHYANLDRTESSGNLNPFRRRMLWVERKENDFKSCPFYKSPNWALQTLVSAKIAKPSAYSITLSGYPFPSTEPEIARNAGSHQCSVTFNYCNLTILMNPRYHLSQIWAVFPRTASLIYSDWSHVSMSQNSIFTFVRGGDVPEKKKKKRDVVVIITNIQ